MVGRVRKTFPGKGWSAQFQFRQEGKMIGIEGPRRSLREGAEADRKFVAAFLDTVPRSSRVDAANDAIKSLGGRGKTSCVGGPGSASHTLDFDPAVLKKMKKPELRKLASRTPGIMRNKKNAGGKWVPKTNKQLIAELLAKKRPAAEVRKSIKATRPVPDSIKAKMRLSDSDGVSGRASRMKNRPASANVAPAAKKRPAAL
jgi:hypothetical protein